MYDLQEKPDKGAQLASGSVVVPLATLTDEYGGCSHIIKDDHCYVLINNSKGKLFQTVKHWYPEAAKALAKLLKDLIMGDKPNSVCMGCDKENDQGGLCNNCASKLYVLVDALKKVGAKLVLIDVKLTSE